jgi:hypothetical protein
VALASPIEIPNDIFTVTVNMAGLRASRDPPETDDGRRWACSRSCPFDEEMLLHGAGDRGRRGEVCAAGVVAQQSS